MGGLAGGPYLYLRDCGLASSVPGGGGFPSFRALLWVEGGRVEGWVRLHDGYPTGGGAGPSARGDAYQTGGEAAGASTSGDAYPSGGEGRGAGPSARGDAYQTGGERAGASTSADAYPTGGEGRGAGPSARGDAYPREEGGAGPSARGDAYQTSWVVGFLREEGETVEEVLCVGRSGHGAVIGPPVLSCYFCACPLYRHGMVFICVCGQGFVLGVCGDQATGVDMSSRAASFCTHDGVGNSRAGLVRVVGDRPTEDGKISGAASARPPARGRGVPRASGAGRGRGRATTPEVCSPCLRRRWHPISRASL
jgi:hypothetical protein